jgi:hypothetical protein
MKLTFARVSALTLFVCAGIGWSATLPNAGVVGPAAFASIAKADYCFARVRGLDPGRMPPAYLVLRLHVRVDYKNTGTRPLIMPVEHERTIYSSLKQGKMTVFKELPGFLQPTLKPLKVLPYKVSKDNPVDPKNDVFALIPAKGPMTPPLFEDIEMPVNHKTLFRNYPDLRGHRVFIRLQLAHQLLDPALETDLSDRWVKFGTPWTGTLLTSTVAIDVPRQVSDAQPCVDGPTENPNNRAQDIGK